MPNYGSQLLDFIGTVATVTHFRSHHEILAPGSRSRQNEINALMQLALNGQIAWMICQPFDQLQRLIPNEILSLTTM